MFENKKAKDYTKVVRARLRKQYGVALPESLIYIVLKIFLRNIHMYLFGGKYDIRLRGFFILYYPKNNRDRYLEAKKQKASSTPPV